MNFTGSATNGTLRPSCAYLHRIQLPAERARVIPCQLVLAGGDGSLQVHVLLSTWTASTAAHHDFLVHNPCDNIMHLQAGPRTAPRRQLGIEVANNNDIFWVDATGQRLDPRQGPLMRSISRLQNDGDVTRPVQGERRRVVQPALVPQGASEQGDEPVGVEPHRRAKGVVVGEGHPEEEEDQSSRCENSQAEVRSPGAAPVK